ncbi:transcriptional regulator [bacterium (Candidatus Howlettbacteria) CG_4_10_14_3_um_filter_37_10]|nr:MAG: transcriptional regulator [bacterium (Candidatus Howlettbacteria) CG23_combo_of_CG06-09_8_20_14_all_37_9]PIY00209.1 MAG: transcriptional regulator [bacterium (Candidatus Howlettbacteria) CG_4_10_14_3_um_filter_37_10]
MAKTTLARIKFGKKLKELRTQAGLSQEKLGFKAELHRTYIGAIERGEQNVSVDNIYKLAKALKVSPKEFFE